MACLDLGVLLRMAFPHLSHPATFNLSRNGQFPHCTWMARIFCFFVACVSHKEDGPFSRGRPEVYLRSTTQEHLCGLFSKQGNPQKGGSPLGPAAGAISFQCRSDDDRVLNYLKPLSHDDTFQARSPGRLFHPLPRWLFLFERGANPFLGLV